jgi:hypothetical protein
MRSQYIPLPGRELYPRPPMHEVGLLIINIRFLLVSDDTSVVQGPFSKYLTVGIF